MCNGYIGGDEKGYIHSEIMIVVDAANALKSGYWLYCFFGFVGFVGFVFVGALLALLL